MVSVNVVPSGAADAVAVGKNAAMGSVELTLGGETLGQMLEGLRRGAEARAPPPGRFTTCRFCTVVLPVGSELDAIQSRLIQTVRPWRLAAAVLDALILGAGRHRIDPYVAAAAAFGAVFGPACAILIAPAHLERPTEAGSRLADKARAALVALHPSVLSYNPRDACASAQDIANSILLLP
jgi:hypothetical protein